MSRRVEVTRRVNGDKPASLTAAIDLISGLEGEWELYLTPVGAEETLTNQQRRFFHMCCGIFARHLNSPGIGDGVRVWNTQRVKREIVTAVFGTVQVVSFVTGEVKEVPACASTEDLTRGQYSRMIDALITVGERQNVKFPDPSRFYDVERARRLDEREPAPAGEGPMSYFGFGFGKSFLAESGSFRTRSSASPNRTPASFSTPASRSMERWSRSLRTSGVVRMKNRSVMLSACSCLAIRTSIKSRRQGTPALERTKVLRYFVGVKANSLRPLKAGAGFYAEWAASPDRLPSRDITSRVTGEKDHETEDPL